MRLRVCFILLIIASVALATTSSGLAESEGDAQRACSQAFSRTSQADACTQSVRPAGEEAALLVAQCFEWVDDPVEALTCIQEEVLDYGPHDSQAQSACAGSFSDTALSGGCMRALLDVRVGGADIVNGCMAHFRDQSSRVDCITATAPARERGGELIAACQRTFRNDRDELDCLRAAGQARRSAVGLVEACARAFETRERELECARAANPLRRRAVETIRACEHAFGIDPDQLACLQAVQGLKRKAPEMVRFCSQSGTNQQRLACLGGA